MRRGWRQAVIDDKGKVERIPYELCEYHARYGGNGMTIYWHVERKNVCIYSAQELFLLRGRGDDRGPSAALHGRRSSPTFACCRG